ncbi:GGDEF domain-containing protein [Parasulfuritortus cantonensis]|uniref:diguanylate cyclase n=1 Tax=Parasulfuritortus cantonensis TaxID=2528202 RepID=A0A4R1B504_9PROT|nr:GGDEF domain-containing protein [Parasulfuritortus cantonensis]TCJ13202.1 GGDEF domain-containing protein [Parasulfuritortus cantonensis]
MEASSHQASEIAREAIKRLAARKLPPTPENFRRAYFEVLGQAPSGAVWPEALRQLLAQWEGYQAGLTQAKKREMLERVLINFGNEPDQLAVKLAALARSWAESGSAAAALVPEDAAEPVAATGVGGTDAAGPLLGQCLTDFAGLSRDLWPDLAARSEALARRVSVPGRAVADADVAAMAGLWREILVRAEDNHAVLGGLKRVLALLLANIGELVSQDAWLSGQTETMRTALADGVNPHALFQVEESLKELVQRQKQLKGSLHDAEEKLKRLISAFILRIGELSASTGHYNARIKGYAARLAEADDIAKLGDVIDGLSGDMAQMDAEIGRSHSELVAAKGHVEEAETRIRALESELEAVSALVREDQLTGALNRRGMDEACRRELARAERMATPFSVGLLDIDNFKRLNDSLGHQAGDQALVHLAGVVRQMLRPTDSLARYGGEEFLLLLPNSDLADAEKVMLRLQRELTRQYFLHDNRRVLITFSAGVAQWAPGEAQAGLLGRADAAMYRAKAAGRNRVERA